MSANAIEEPLTAGAVRDGDGASDEYVTATVAREMLGCSRVVLARLLREGTLPFTPDALDKRIKWVRRDAVTRLMNTSVAASAEDGAGTARRKGRARVAAGKGIQ